MPSPDKQITACKQFAGQSKAQGFTEEAAAWERVAASLEESDPRPRVSWGILAAGASVAAALVIYLGFYR